MPNNTNNKNDQQNPRSSAHKSANSSRPQKGLPLNLNKDEWQPIEWTISKTGALDKAMMEKALREKELQDKSVQAGKEIPAAKKDDSALPSFSQKMDMPIKEKKDTAYGRAYDTIKRLEDTLIEQTNFDIMNLKKETMPIPDQENKDFAAFYSTKSNKTDAVENSASEEARISNKQQSLFISELPKKEQLDNPLEKTFTASTSLLRKISVREDSPEKTEKPASDTEAAEAILAAHAKKRAQQSPKAETNKEIPEEHFLVTSKEKRPLIIGRSKKPTSRMDRAPRMDHDVLHTKRAFNVSVASSLLPLPFLAIGLGIFFIVAIVLGLIFSGVAFAISADMQTAITLPLIIFLLASAAAAYGYSRINKNPSPVQIIILLVIANVISIFLGGLADISWLGVIIKAIASIVIGLLFFNLAQRNHKYYKKRAR